MNSKKTEVPAVLAENKTYGQLEESHQELLIILKNEYRFSYSQIQQTISWVKDFQMWKIQDPFDLIAEKITHLELDLHLQGSQKRDRLFEMIRDTHKKFAALPTQYDGVVQKEFKEKFRFEDFEMEHNKIRLCPAASPETMVCCNLKTIAVVDNCSLGCSYCVLQNHYGEAIIKVPTNLSQILETMKVPKDKRLRIGTGEYSDSLLWGNRNDILKSLMDFAQKHSNIILELKTKSTNIKWLLDNELPPNLCISFSLNPQVLIDHEEKGTASLENRIKAAEKLVAKGVKVGFHLHPMMYYVGWETDYQDLIATLISRFKPSQVLWVSFGVVTIMKGFATQFRENYQHSRLLQMELTETPEGKLSYPFEVRRALYENALQAFLPWQDKVFQYLCMEGPEMWDQTMPYTYKSIREFDDTFNDSAFAKL